MPNLNLILDAAAQKDLIHQTVTDNLMRDAVVKDLMRDAIVKDDLSHDNFEASLAIKTDGMRDAVVKDDAFWYSGDDDDYIASGSGSGSNSYTGYSGSSEPSYDDVDSDLKKTTDEKARQMIKDSLMRDAVVKDDEMRDAVVKDKLWHSDSEDDSGSYSGSEDDTYDDVDSDLKKND